MFFVPYVILEWPSAVLAKKIGPRVFLPASVFLWGIVMICFGFVKTWNQLAGLRVIIGVLEAGLFPGALFLLQSWYCRCSYAAHIGSKQMLTVIDDVHKRYASFYLISLTGGSLSGVLASGFMQMQGVGGYLGWRYIFIWEGVLTILVAAIGAYLIVDFPQAARNTRKFLTERELDFVIKLLEQDRGEVDEDKFAWGPYLRSALDLKIWAMGLMFL